MPLTERLKRWPRRSGPGGRAARGPADRRRRWPGDRPDAVAANGREPALLGDGASPPCCCCSWRVAGHGVRPVAREAPASRAGSRRLQGRARRPEGGAAQRRQRPERAWAWAGSEVAVPDLRVVGMPGQRQMSRTAMPPREDSGCRLGLSLPGPRDEKLDDVAPLRRWTNCGRTPATWNPARCRILGGAAWTAE